jgi:hypothetical protein
MTEETQVQINFKIDPALKAELERRSREERRSMSAHITYLIERDIRISPPSPIQSQTLPQTQASTEAA